MRIENIKIKNFKGFEDFDGKVEGKNVYLIGSNKAGKTSFIDAVWVGLDGKNIPDDAVTTGSKRGLIELDLGDFVARTKLTRGKPAKFELENKNFSSEAEKFISAPRSYMEKKIGLIDFDIMGFFNKSNAEQLKYIAKVLNVDFGTIDGDIEEIEDGRKFDKRRLKTLEGQIVYYDEKLAKEKIVDIVQLSKDIEAQKTGLRDFDGVTDGLVIRRKTITEKGAARKALQAQLDALDAEVLTLNKQVADGDQWLKDNDSTEKREALTALELKMSTANDNNALITEAKTGKAIDDEVEELKEGIEAANDDIAAKRTEKACIISKNINVEGLTYDTGAERFLFDGLPFAKNQINTAEQLISGMKIASTMLKDLKIVRVDASLIDKHNFERVLEWSKNEGIELFVELVDREGGKLKIEIQDDNV